MDTNVLVLAAATGISVTVFVVAKGLDVIFARAAVSAGTPPAPDYEAQSERRELRDRIHSLEQQNDDLRAQMQTCYERMNRQQEDARRQQEDAARRIGDLEREVSRLREVPSRESRTHGGINVSGGSVSIGHDAVAGDETSHLSGQSQERGDKPTNPTGG